MVQAVQVPFQRPDPGLQERHCPLALSQVRQPVQAAQTKVVPPGEKVSFVQTVHEELLIRIDPGLQDEHEPSVAEQVAQLGQAWQAWLLLAGLKVALAQGVQVPLVSPSPALQARQAPVVRSQVGHPMQLVQLLVPPIEKLVPQLLQPVPLFNPNPGRHDVQIPVLSQMVQPTDVQSAHGTNP